MDEEIRFIGRRLIYELSSGKVVYDSGERAGYVRETTPEEDYPDFDPARHGVIELEYGALAEDFARCTGLRVDVSGDTPKLIFSYPDSGSA